MAFRSSYAAIWLFVVLSTNLFAARKCKPITDGTSTRLSQYVQTKFGFAPSTVFAVKEWEFVEGTCYRKVHFRSDQVATMRPRDIELYLSPDFRFLSRELLDSTLASSQPKQADVKGLASELVKGDFPARGTREAPVTITIFSDFQCPFCREEAAILARVVDNNSADVRLVFRNLPLAEIHPWASSAAEMAACAYQQSNDAFWAVHDALFSQQGQITKDNLNTTIEEIISPYRGIDLRTYNECVTQHNSVPRIQRDLVFAREHGIEATPTIFINGIRKDGLMQFEEMRATIQLVASGSNKNVGEPGAATKASSPLR